MTRPFIHQLEPLIGDEERRAVAEYLESGGWLTEYERTREFERAIAQVVGCRHASVVTSGTVSLYLALSALGIGSGDEVIVPDFTQIASANAVTMTGATPVLVDIEPRTHCLDLDIAESAITSKTKAVMVVSLNGRAPDMSRAPELAEAYGLDLIEDAAQAFGSFWKGEALGTIGSVGCFSFTPHKVVTTGQGGAIVTDDDDLMERILQLKDFGRARAGVDEHVALGYNFKFTDLQAVVGLAQLKKLDWRLERKRQIYDLYRKELEALPEVTFVETDLSEAVPLFVDILAPDPGKLRTQLLAQGIGSRPFYPPVHTQAPYLMEAAYPVAEAVSRNGLWLPSALSLDDETIRHICMAIRTFFRARTPTSASSCASSSMPHSQ